MNNIKSKLIFNFYKLFKKPIKSKFIKIGSKNNFHKSTIKTLYFESENFNQLKYCNIKGSIKIGNKVKIENSSLCGKIILSNDSQLFDTQINGSFEAGEGLKIIQGGAKLNGDIEIGRFTTLNGPNFDIHSKINKVKIGSFCSISRNVAIQEYNHRIDRITSYFIGSNLFKEKNTNEINSKGDIVIENDVWIGANCTILPGAYISNGAVIGANSLVNCFIPPYAIAAGSPAKVIKYRFSQKEIEKILKLKYWNWSKEKIKKNKHLFLEKFDPNLLDNIL